MSTEDLNGPDLAEEFTSPSTKFKESAVTPLTAAQHRATHKSVIPLDYDEGQSVDSDDDLDGEEYRVQTPAPKPVDPEV